jgi:hypothetical protein
MYEIQDNTARFNHEIQYDFEQFLPDPLDHWTLRDFADIVPIASYAS